MREVGGRKRGCSEGTVGERVMLFFCVLSLTS